MKKDLIVSSILLAGSIPGYFLGAHFAQRVPAKVRCSVKFGVLVSPMKRQVPSRSLKPRLQS